MFKKLFVYLLSGMLFLGAFSVDIYAASTDDRVDEAVLYEEEPLTEEGVLTPAEGQAASNNLHFHTYYGSWMDRPYSFLYEHNGEIVRVEYVADDVNNRYDCTGSLRVEYYSSDLQFLRGYNVAMELPVFGGFYKGEDALYLVLGKDNPSEDPKAEVIRVIKYDLDWNRLGSVSYHGINTKYPFDFGNVSMTEYGDFLYIHTCHIIFIKPDGKNHQTNMTLSLNKKTMKPVSAAYLTEGCNLSYVSHSFVQFIKFDGDDAIVVDLGDTYPRGIRIGFSEKTASEGYVDGDDMPKDPDGMMWGRFDDFRELEILQNKYGNYGENYTGINVGGFEISSSNILTATTYVSLNESFRSNTDWNVRLFVTPKKIFKGQGFTSGLNNDSKIVSLTTDAGNGKQYDNPYIKKVGDDLFVVMWEVIENNGFTGTYQAVAVNGKGDKVSEVTTFNGGLSDCEPILLDGRLLWYTTGGGRFWSKLVYDQESGELGYVKAPSCGGPSTPVFYSLSLSKSGSNYILTQGNGNASGVKATMDFVSRLYTIILGREAESGGLDHWTNKLVNKELTGAEVASGFIDSEEFGNQGTSDSAFVRKLYKAFFDREPDAGGYNMWMSRLATGADRKTVLAGFTNSEEFGNLCGRFGIERGSLDYPGLPSGDDSKAGHFLLIDSKNVDVDKLNEYVERLYTKILGRSGEAKGMAYWRDEILSGNKYDAATAARTGFFTSDEYLKKNKSDEDFITDAYHAFFNREPDKNGYEYWKEQLKNGSYDRESMIDVGFGHSTEFINLLKSYGFEVKQ